MATTADAVREYQQFIGGQWTAASSGKTFDDKDPFTGETVAVVPAGDGDDARKAIEAAAAAFPAWAATPPAARQAIFLKAADILESRQDEVVSMLARETGATFGFGMFQMHFVPGLFRQAAAAPYQPIGQIIPSDTGALDRSAACARQHGGAEAERMVAMGGWARVGRDLRGGGPAGGSAQHRHARAGQGR